MKGTLHRPMITHDGRAMSTVATKRAMWLAGRREADEELAAEWAEERAAAEIVRLAIEAKELTKELIDQLKGLAAR